MLRINSAERIASLKAQTARTGWVMEMEIELGTQPCSAGRYVNALLISPVAIGCQVRFGGCAPGPNFFHHRAQQSSDQSRNPYFNAETQSSQRPEYFFDQVLFTRRPSPAMRSHRQVPQRFNIHARSETLNSELFIADGYRASGVPTQLSLLYRAQGSEITMEFWI